MQEALFGNSRTHVAARHALIAPDGHVASALPGWEGATPYYMISPAMGAKLSQIRAVFDESGGTATFTAHDFEQAIYVEKGNVAVTCGEETAKLTAQGFAYLPPGEIKTLTTSSEASVTIFEKQWEPLESCDSPSFMHGNTEDVVAEPFLGFETAMLKTLFPTDLRWDLAMNLFTYAPGGTLPFVETHIMEHGLLMTGGQGVYRLEDSYYPVAKGDAIWMAPYCPQWFVAMGDQPASYLYYKNVNRRG